MGTGAVPHSDAKLDSVASRSGLSPAVHSRRARGLVADTVTREQRRGDGIEDRFDRLIQVGDLGVEGKPPAPDRDERPLRATSRGARVRGPGTGAAVCTLRRVVRPRSRVRIGSGAVSHTLWS